MKMENMVSIADTEIASNRFAPVPTRSSPSSVQFRLAQTADLPVLARFRVEQVGSTRGGTHQAIPDFCRSFEAFLLERIKTRESASGKLNRKWIEFLNETRDE
jgi:hypothetical protein